MSDDGARTEARKYLRDLARWSNLGASAALTLAFAAMIVGIFAGVFKSHGLGAIAMAASALLTIIGWFLVSEARARLKLEVELLRPIACIEKVSLTLGPKEESELKMFSLALQACSDAADRASRLAESQKVGPDTTAPAQLPTSSMLQPVGPVGPSAS